MKRWPIRLLVISTSLHSLPYFLYISPLSLFFAKDSVLGMRLASVFGFPERTNRAAREIRFPIKAGGRFGFGFWAWNPGPWSLGRVSSEAGSI